MYSPNMFSAVSESHRDPEIAIAHSSFDRVSWGKWSVILAALLFCSYAIQIFSPLRINFDAVTLLNLAATVTDGKPYLLHGSRPLFPIGVPLVFSSMERMGIANPAGFACLNLMCMVVAAFATLSICRSLQFSGTAVPMIVLLSFSSFVLFKHSVIPVDRHSVYGGLAAVRGKPGNAQPPPRLAMGH